MSVKININKIANLSGHKAAIFALAPALEENCFFSGDGNGWIVKWNMDEPETGKLIAKVPSNIFSLCLIPSLKYLAVGSMQGVSYFIDLMQNKVVPPTLKFGKGIFSIKKLENKLFLGTGKGTLSFMSLDQLSSVQTLPISNKSIRNIAFHPFEKIAAIGASDGIIYILDTTTLKITQQLAYHKSSVFSLLFTPSGGQLISGSRDAHIAVWDVRRNYELSHALPAHLFTINSIAISPNGQLLATASRDKSIKIWSVKENFKLLKVIDSSKKSKFKVHINSINILLWSRYNDYLISASDDRKVMIWDIQ